jgi:hypothetical protein
MGVSADGAISFACQFNLKLLEDWKMLCAMFKSEKWLEMFAESQSGQYYEKFDERPAIVPVKFRMVVPHVPSPSSFDLDDEDSVEVYFEWEFETLKTFFNSIEPQLADCKDLTVLYKELLKSRRSGDENQRRNTIFNAQVIGTFADASIGTRDFSRQSQSFSSLARHASLLVSLVSAFQEIGVPDDYVKMKLMVAMN